MQRKRNNIAVLLFTALYLITAVISGIGHAHAIYDASQGHKVSSHDCGKNERHLPIGAEKHCSVCQQIHQFVSYLVATTITSTDENVNSVVSENNAFYVSVFSQLENIERGPPLRTSLI